MGDLLRLDRDGPVLTITLNRPEARNAIGHADGEEFERVCEGINADRGIRALVLAASGTVFSAGGDIKAMAQALDSHEPPAQVRYRYRDGIQRVPRALYALEVPTIAVVNGPAIGVGCDLACMCDIRVAAPQARFGQTFVKLGLVPGDGGAWFLPRIIGWSRASQMAFTGEPIGAEQALAWGLVSQVVELDLLLDTGHTLARAIAANPSDALRMTKRLLRESQTAGLDTLLEMSAGFQALAHTTREHAEAVRALLAGMPGAKPA